MTPSPHRTRSFARSSAAAVGAAVLALALLPGLIGPGAALGIDHHGVAEQELARATVAGKFRVGASGRSDLLTTKVTIPAGAQIPWHKASGATLVSVRSGTFTLQSATGRGCTTRRYRAGTGVVIPAGQVHRGRNTGDASARLVVVYLGVPVGETPESMAPRPAGCR